MIEKIQGEKVNLISKNNKWATWILKDIALQMVAEGAVAAPTGRSNVYKMVYTKKEIQTYIKERDKEHCRFCTKQGEEMIYLIPEKMGGLETPINLIWGCSECKEKINQKKSTEIETYVAPFREENNVILNQKETIRICSCCQEEKLLPFFTYVHSKHNIQYCKECVENEKGYFLLDKQKEIIGIKEEHVIRQMKKQEEVCLVKGTVYHLTSERKQRKCALCHQFKLESYEMEKRICHECKNTKKEEGYLDVKTKKWA